MRSADIAEASSALTTLRSTDGALTAVYDINSWPGGYCLSGTVTNVGRTSTQWKTVIDLKGTTPNSTWGGKVTMTPGQVTIGSQNSLSPKSTATLGVCGVTPTTNRPAVTSLSAPGTTPLCGNGVVETGEQCDDGNTANEEPIAREPQEERTQAFHSLSDPIDGFHGDQRRLRQPEHISPVELDLGFYSLQTPAKCDGPQQSGEVQPGFGRSG